MRYRSISLVFAVVAAVSAPLAALDTTEPFGKGPSDFEIYAGFDGIGASRDARGFSAESVLGFGFTDRFSGSVALSAEANDTFAEGSGAFSFGLFGTPLDTDHVDLDLFFSIGSDFSFSPGIELNFDFKPDLALAGLYLKAEHTMIGERKNDDDNDPKYRLVNESGIAAGGYYTVAEGMQLFAEFDFAVRYDPPDGVEMVTVGGPALGFNAVVAENFEIISQVRYDIPQKGEDHAVGIAVGLIVTMM